MREIELQSLKKGSCPYLRDALGFQDARLEPLRSNYFDQREVERAIRRDARAQRFLFMGHHPGGVQLFALPLTDHQAPDHTTTLAYLTAQPREVVRSQFIGDRISDPVIRVGGFARATDVSNLEEVLRQRVQGSADEVGHITSIEELFQSAQASEDWVVARQSIDRPCRLAMCDKPHCLAFLAAFQLIRAKMWQKYTASRFRAPCHHSLSRSFPHCRLSEVIARYICWQKFKYAMCCMLDGRSHGR